MGLNNIEDKHKEELKFSNGIEGNIVAIIEKRHFLLMTFNSIEDEHNGATKNSTGIQCNFVTMT